jgi:glycosyltransferase involved in cell wall biosynthesis
VRVIVFGTYDVRFHPRVAVLMEGLRSAGHEVREINVPLGLDTAGRVAMLRQPWRLPVLAAKLARCWSLLSVRARRTRSQFHPDMVLVGYLGHFDVRLARRLFPGTTIVLDHLVSAAGTARDRGLAGSGGAKSRLLNAIDDGALASADVIVVDTSEHLDALPAAVRDRGVVCPVGAAHEWYSAAGQRRTGEQLRAIFVGLFTPLHGAPVIARALALLAADPDIEVTMVGTGQDYAECRRIAAADPHVTWLDWVPAERLPALVAGHDVSLGIFGTTPKALKVVPNKVFQGAAAGCAIVTSDTPPQRAALGEAAVLVPPGDPDALAQALRRLAKDPEELDRLRTAAAARAKATFTPAAVVAPLVSRLHIRDASS